MKKQFLSFLFIFLLALPFTSAQIVPREAKVKFLYTTPSSCIPTNRGEALIWDASAFALKQCVSGSYVTIGSGAGTATDLTLSLSDNTTGNVNTSRHGFAPKAPNDAGKFLDGTGAWSVPVIAQNTQSADYTAVLTDSGKHLYHPASDANARIFTIPANASVPYPIGTAITFVNESNTVSIAITSDTLVLAGTGATGTRSLAAYGVATAIKVGSTRWIISGTGIS